MGSHPGRSPVARWPGGTPIVAHPPCGQWGMLAHMAAGDDEQKHLARTAVMWVRHYGGVLEHPHRSALWADQGLPAPGAGTDGFGWSTAVSQKWWGHPAEKQTWLYIVGCAPKDVPPLPFLIGEAAQVCGRSGRRRDGSRTTRRPEMLKSQRDATPRAFAEWLVELARRCRR